MDKMAGLFNSLCVRNKDGSLTIPKSRVGHWEKEITTKYIDLSENLKEYDREEVKNTIVALKKHNFEIILCKIKN